MVNTALLVILCGGTLAAQRDATFKGGARTVAVYATVTNAEGRLVPDLPRDAFSVFDIGYFRITSTNDLVSTFQRVADELHRQYALGFAPAALDGKMHTIEVRLAGTGMTARARKSYLARKER